MASATFVICTERGLLEPMSVTLVRSLRKFGGAFKDAPVLSYQPRPGYEITAETLQTLEKLEVKHITESLNKRYVRYPQGNKPPVCAHAERTATTEFIVFLDSDVVVLNEPNGLRLPVARNIGLRPADKVGVATSGSSDANYAYWQSMYHLLDIDKSSVERVTTTIDQQSIHAYYNSGVMSVRRSAGIFDRWNHNFERVMEARLKPQQGIFHTDQTTLAATLAQQRIPVEVLPATYNYPFHLQEEIPVELRITTLQEATLLHYHKALHEEDGVAQLAELDGEERQQWLIEQVAYLRTVMPPPPRRHNPLQSLINRLTARLR